MLKILMIAGHCGGLRPGGVQAPANFLWTGQLMSTTKRIKECDTCLSGTCLHPPPGVWRIHLAGVAAILSIRNCNVDTQVTLTDRPFWRPLQRRQKMKTKITMTAMTAPMTGAE